MLALLALAIMLACSGAPDPVQLRAAQDRCITRIDDAAPEVFSQYPGVESPPEEWYRCVRLVLDPQMGSTAGGACLQTSAAASVDASDLDARCTDDVIRQRLTKLMDARASGLSSDVAAPRSGSGARPVLGVPAGAAVLGGLLLVAVAAGRRTRGAARS